MKLLVHGTALGESPHYVAPTGRTHAPTIRELLQTIGDGEHAIDPVGLQNYFHRQPDGTRTSFLDARLLPAGSDLYDDGANFHCRDRELLEMGGALLPLLEKILEELISVAPRIALALSGGLDSALVLALAQRVKPNSFSVFTLATHLPGYCELEQSLETARLLGISDVEIIRVSETDLISAVPEAIAACETPLFNLHPVARFVLARAVAQRGFHALLTGDGADQVFAASDPRNYLPIVGAMVRSTGLKLLSPFFDNRVVSSARMHGTDPQKTQLRQAASEILPRELVWRKKTPRLTPDFDLSAYRDSHFENRLAPQLASPLPNCAPGPVQTLWATTAILMRHLGGTC